MKSIKLTIMLLLGLLITIFPDSLISIAILVLGAYLIFLGVNALVSTLNLIKYRRGWQIEGVRALVFITVGLILLFNVYGLALTLSGVFFVIIGLAILALGILAIIRSGEQHTGVVLIVIGLLITIFPIGISHLITRVIGISLIFISTTLILRSKSS